MAQLHSLPLLLVGSPRSGTTWLAEVINATGDFRYLFEPFHPAQSPDWEGLGWQPMLRWPLDPSELEYKAAGRESFVAMSYRSIGWALRHGRQYSGATRVMIKTGRAQFMLSAIRALKAESSLLLVVRDPVATAAPSSSLASNTGNRVLLRPQNGLARSRFGR